MDISILANHLLITLVAWIAGLIVGGVGGVLIASLIRPRTSPKPDSIRGLAWIPWRTLVFMLMLVVWSPLIPVWLGLGTTTGMVISGFAISLIALPMMMSMSLNDSHTRSWLVHFISKARSLLFFAQFAALGVGYFGGGGAGLYLVEQMKLLDYGKVFQGFLIIVGLALVLDLVFGAIESGTASKALSSSG